MSRGVPELDAEAPHLNRVVELLEAGETVFGRLVQNWDDAAIRDVADSDHDFVIIEMEHAGFDFTRLGHSLDAMLNRHRIFESTSLAPAVAPFVRVPTTGRDPGEWIVKQTLDLGAYGIVVPQMGTVAEAKAYVAAMRYPRPQDPSQAELPGVRGWANPRDAARYWGISVQEYIERSDLWPVNPRGDAFLMLICETAEGVRNLPDIVRDVPGISAVWAGVGDLSFSLGHPTDYAHPEVEGAMQNILETCDTAGIPCCVAANPATVERRISEGFRIILTSALAQHPDTLETGRPVAGR
jgi:4-hydroxy-2-oxoheptanedioate aldolase